MNAKSNLYAAQNRRAYPRLRTEISARLLINGKVSAVARASDLSAGGAALSCDYVAKGGDHVVAHFDGGARLEGSVVRDFEGGFAIAFDMSATRRETLFKTLNPSVPRNEQLKALTLERRLAPRIANIKAPTKLKVGAITCECVLLDLSLSGVSFSCESDLPLGAPVNIGLMSGHILRRDGHTYGVVFQGVDCTKITEGFGVHPGVKLVRETGELLSEHEPERP